MWSRFAGLRRLAVAKGGAMKNVLDGLRDCRRKPTTAPPLQQDTWPPPPPAPAATAPAVAPVAVWPPPPTAPPPAPPAPVPTTSAGSPAQPTGIHAPPITTPCSSQSQPCSSVTAPTAATITASFNTSRFLIISLASVEMTTVPFIHTPARPGQQGNSAMASFLHGCQTGRHKLSWRP